MCGVWSVELWTAFPFGFANERTEIGILEVEVNRDKSKENINIDTSHVTVMYSTGFRVDGRRESRCDGCDADFPSI